MRKPRSILLCLVDSPMLCRIKQPDFSDTSNMIFRIPTPCLVSG